MPIGLPRAGRRACDLLAKQALGKAHPRVFLAPPRDVLAATSYDDAGARHRAHADGLGLSVQTWNIVDKIREVDAVADDPRLVEVHPELSFARLAGAVLVSKHRPEGARSGSTPWLAGGRVCTTCRRATTGSTRWPRPGPGNGGCAARPSRCRRARRATTSAARCASSSNPPGPPEMITVRDHDLLDHPSGNRALCQRMPSSTVAN